jgi:predicted GH43/DUF377 family glycosyl hydrolase
VIDPDEHSHLVVARSQDGLTDWRIQDLPLLSPGPEAAWYETLGCEDARITYLAERGEYVIAYVGASHQGAGVCLAMPRDFRSVGRFGLVIHPYNKDAALFPQTINGRYLMLHCPSAGPLENIWLSESDNLRHWGNPKCVLQEEEQLGWDSGKVGTGPSPIETPDGWLLIFHGVQLEETGRLYGVGLVLLDLEDPGKIIATVPHWVFGPKATYELHGEKPDIVFPTGAIVQNGFLRLYYGAADTTVAVATAPLADLLHALRNA